MVHTIGLHVYPAGESLFTLYEDDGITYNYLKGAVVMTENHMSGHIGGSDPDYLSVLSAISAPLR